MLDFSQVVTQINAFTAGQVGTLPQFQAALQEAGKRLRDSVPKWESTCLRIQDSRTSWLVADWFEPPDVRYTAPPRPTPCVVLASDGSQIVSDRHEFALCYLLNIGLIALRYGPDANACLRSRPTLHCAEDDPEDTTQGEQAAIPPRRLAMRRLLSECAGLSELADDTRDDAPSIALCDGSLILWPLESETDAFRAESLTQFQQHLDTFRDRRIPFVGYISRPGSRDVVNALRVFRCPHPRADCDIYCPNRSKPKQYYVAPECIGTERVTDADLFALLLKPGERSAVFGSRSKILNQYRDDHKVRFFYLHTGDEIARVEIPHWVAADDELLNRTHTLCLDQIQKGEGYPVALAEAHEQAVIRAPERDAFFQLLERDFVQASQTVTHSRKAVSKRARRI